MKKILILCSVILLLASFSNLFADVIITQNGKTITGKITKESDKITEIMDYYGEVHKVKFWMIKDVKKEGSLFDDYDEFLASNPGMDNSAEGNIKIAEWCNEKGLLVKVLEHYNKILKLDDSNKTIQKEIKKIQSKIKKDKRTKKHKFPKKSSGLIKKAYLETPKGKLEYAAFIPSKYKSSKPSACVICMHGNGGHALEFMNRVRPPMDSSWLFLSMERCSSRQSGYPTEYLYAFLKEFNLDPEKTYLVAYSGGGFRAWTEILSDEFFQRQFAALCFVGCGKSGDSPDKLPEFDKKDSPSVCYVADTRTDPNYTKSGPQALKLLEKHGYPKPKIIKTNQGHIWPGGKMRDVANWFKKQKKKKSFTK